MPFLFLFIAYPHRPFPVKVELSKWKSPLNGGLLYLAPEAGLEPAARWLTATCSTD